MIKQINDTWPRADPAGDCKAILDRGIEKRLPLTWKGVVRFKRDKRRPTSKEKQIS